MGKKKLGLSGYLHVRESYDELEDPEVPEKPKWCGEHKPESDVCPVHNLRWEEMHLAGYGALAGLAALFYCPILNCTELEPAWYYLGGLKIVVSRGDLALKFGLPSGSGYELLAETAIYNKLQIRALAHKLGKFEGDGK